MSQKKKTTITAQQAESLNSTLNYMAVLIMRLQYHLQNEKLMPEHEQEMVFNFLDWYCDQFGYVITSDGKLDQKPVVND